MKAYEMISGFLILMVLSSARAESGWIDPFDMSLTNEVHDSPHDLLSEARNALEKPDCKCEESRSHSYLKRVINLILNSVHEDYSDDKNFRGHIVFEVDSGRYKKLKAFAEGKFVDLHEIDSILSDVIRKPTWDYLEEVLMPFFMKAFRSVTSRTGIFTTCISAYIIVVYKMMKGHFRLGYIVKFLFINAVMFDFVFVWIQLYQKAEINKHADMVKFANAPKYCNPNEMTTMQIFINYFSSEDKCREYYQVTLSDIYWNVSPGDVLMEMFTRTITQPIKAIGPAIGTMIHGIYGSLPFGMGFFLLPVTLIFIFFMTCVLLSFILNVPIDFNFFHLFSLSFGSRGNHNADPANIVHENSMPRSIENRVHATGVDKGQQTDDLVLQEITSGEVGESSGKVGGSDKDVDEDKENVDHNIRKRKRD